VSSVMRGAGSAAYYYGCEKSKVSYLPTGCFLDSDRCCWIGPAVLSFFVRQVLIVDCKKAPCSGVLKSPVVYTSAFKSQTVITEFGLNYYNLVAFWTDGCGWIGPAVLLNFLPVLIVIRNGKIESVFVRRSFVLARIASPILWRALIVNRLHIFVYVSPSLSHGPK
jgi:hypothetical protein